MPRSANAEPLERLANAAGIDQEKPTAAPSVRDILGIARREPFAGHYGSGLWQIGQARSTKASRIAGIRSDRLIRPTSFPFSWMNTRRKSLAIS
jgi:hypothetical protein